MGNWNCYIFDGSWTSHETPDDIPEPLGDRTLRLFLADSDFAEVRYDPVTAPGTGSAFVGYTPRTYFENDEAPGCTDTAPDAAGLAAWAGPGVSPIDVQELLADDDSHGPGEDDDPFVETTLTRLVALLRLPPVPW